MESNYLRFRHEGLRDCAPCLPPPLECQQEHKAKIKTKPDFGEWRNTCDGKEETCRANMAADAAYAEGWTKERNWSPFKFVFGLNSLFRFEKTQSSLLPGLQSSVRSVTVLNTLSNFFKRQFKSSPWHCPLFPLVKCA